MSAPLGFASLLLETSRPRLGGTNQLTLVAAPPTQKLTKRRIECHTTTIFRSSRPVWVAIVGLYFFDFF